MFGKKDLLNQFAPKPKMDSKTLEESVTLLENGLSEFDDMMESNRLLQEEGREIVARLEKLYDFTNDLAEKYREKLESVERFGKSHYIYTAMVHAQDKKLSTLSKKIDTWVVEVADAIRSNEKMKKERVLLEKTLEETKKQYIEAVKEETNAISDNN